MASKILSQILQRHNTLRPSPTRNVLPRLLQARNFQLTTETGGLPTKPEGMRFGLLKVMVVLLPFIYFGAVMSREGAAWLEENDIFSPEDDD